MPPVGNRPRSSCAKWLSSCSRSSSNRKDRLPHLKLASPRTPATPTVLPRLIRRMRNGPPALASTDDLVRSEGTPHIVKRSWCPRRSSRSCPKPVAVGRQHGARVLHIGSGGAHQPGSDSTRGGAGLRCDHPALRGNRRESPPCPGQLH